jgi:hypothetical protein
MLTYMVPLTTALGNLFAPLSGVLAFHYLFIQKMRVDVPALFNAQGIYHYWHGVNLVAVAWCFLGSPLYYRLPIAALPALLTPPLTGCAYLLTVLLIEKAQSGPHSGNYGDMALPALSVQTKMPDAGKVCRARTEWFYGRMVPRP